MMDFGATVCKPQAPLCLSCVFREQCFAFRNDRVDSFPSKLEKPTVRTRWLYFLVLRHNEKLAVRKRSSGDIWENLFEFPSIESAKKWDGSQVRKEIRARGYPPVGTGVSYTQQLTHQKIEATFFIIDLDDHSKLPAGYSYRTKRALNKLAFPKMLRQFLKENNPLG